MPPSSSAEIEFETSSKSSTRTEASPHLEPLIEATARLSSLIRPGSRGTTPTIP